MPTLIWSKVKDGLDPAMKKKAYAFFEKLSEDDTLPGLHIEPIMNSVDSRVRTGRVDDNFRCVLFKINSTSGSTYVIHGIWPHDKANAIAERVRLSMNPINGVPEVERVMEEVRAAVTELTPGPTVTPTRELAPEPVPEAAVVEAAPRWPEGLTAEIVHTDLGIQAELAAAALAAPTESALMDVVATARVEWQGLALLELATGVDIEAVRALFRLDETPELPTGTDDERLLAALQQHPTARVSFHVIDDNAELRRIIEAGDFGAWRLFLHPEQRQYADRDYAGAFRLSGGAGTGKTVVAVHRSHRLHRADASARVLLTTYTRNLADDLGAQLMRLDDTVTLATHLGEPGLHARGIDAVAWGVVQRAGDAIQAACVEVLGGPREAVLKGTPDTVWREAIEEYGGELPPELATPAFLAAEYGLIILPGRITTEQGYIRARRTGRGRALGRAQRAAIWRVVQAYRDKARAAGTTDFEEKAALAAVWLEGVAEGLFDHVLVDEAQDFTPSHLQLLRALVPAGPNDLFLCEDSHQRIYGHKVTLSAYGIAIRGRSRSLTLNYRTTAQNLGWAMRILSGGLYSDLEGTDESHLYRSSLSGPEPMLLPATSMSDQLDRARELIRGWLPLAAAPDGTAPDADSRRTSAPETIAVLVRDKYRRDSVVSGLGERGLDVRPVDRENPKPGKPLVMTMHRAKGLEFTHVLLFDVQEGAIPRSLKDYESSPEDMSDAMLRERSLLYVAATRARDVLAVSWAGKRSPLLDGV